MNTATAKQNRDPQEKMVMFPYYHGGEVLGEVLQYYVFFTSLYSAYRPEINAGRSTMCYYSQQSRCKVTQCTMFLG